MRLWYVVLRDFLGGGGIKAQALQSDFTFPPFPVAGAEGQFCGPPKYF
ncbi:hypothetical protein [Acidocella sp.]|nr:hypothetical protein [Acidocella sp.]